jgi:UDP-N-acetylmuramoylalanine--D-glutamate ligase
MKLDGTKVLVVGLGRTGMALARFLTGRGADVTVTDRATPEELKPQLQNIRDLNLRLALGGHDAETFAGADLVVLSPGVPHDMQPIKEARKKGARILGEIELAACFIETPVVAVTGTNGKTTATALLGEMLEQSGSRVFVGGNIGNPLIDYVTDSMAADIVVAEVSSFQLDTTEAFRPDVGVLLNITEDHLDRYAGFDAYAESKFRLFKNQRPSDTAVLNGGDPVIRNLSKTVRARKLFFNKPGDREEGAIIQNEKIVFRLGEKDRPSESLDLSGFNLKGKHNVENAAAAGLAALAAGATMAGIEKAIKRFQGLDHRMAYVATIAGVKYFNDSKATNVDAVARAIDSFHEPLVLIMGGRDKGGDFGRLTGLVERHVKRLILMGEAGDQIAGSLESVTPVETVASMEDAVSRAHEIAETGDTVILSPGCASFDMYDNYAHRGESFRKAVERIKRKFP